jgi:transposase-like protein
MKSAMDMTKLMDAFDTEAECRAYLEELRWPKGIECPRCKGTTISRIQKRDQFDCDSCRYQFSVMSGTIFHDSHLPLPKWFIATYLMCESKKGMSANQMKRILGVSYKTAWYLCHRIRAAMREANPEPLNGTVEVDETYVGGRRRNVGSGRRDHMKMVVAALQRHGEIRITTGERNTRKVLHGFIRANVADSAENIYTDELPAYKGCGDANTTHASVNHSKEEWVRGDVHTNSVEGAFGLFKRSIVGSFHQISHKHLELYLDEFEFRFNNRKNPYLFRDTMLKLIGSPNVEYKKLVA